MIFYMLEKKFSFSGSARNRTSVNIYVFIFIFRSENFRMFAERQGLAEKQSCDSFRPHSLAIEEGGLVSFPYWRSNRNVPTPGSSSPTSRTLPHLDAPSCPLTICFFRSDELIRFVASFDSVERENLLGQSIVRCLRLVLGGVSAI